MAELQTIYGIHAVEALISKRADRIVNVWFDQQRVDEKFR